MNLFSLKFVPVFVTGVLAATSYVNASASPEPFTEIYEQAKGAFTGQTTLPKEGVTEEDLKNNRQENTYTIYAGEDDEIIAEKKKGKLDGHRNYGKGADGEGDPSQFVKKRDEIEHKIENVLGDIGL